jgi:molybdopterin synthase catalytic subunit
MSDASVPEPAEGAQGAEGPTAFALISDDPLDRDTIESFVLSPANGALVTFYGVVRNHDHGLAVSALEYQAHPDAARFLDEACATIAAESGLRVAAAHRSGYLSIGDVALVASVAAPHRAEAFAACEKLVDLIKLTVPIWKRQHLADGATEWVGL